MRVDQSDRILAAFYKPNCILLELDAREVPVRAYRRTVPTESPRAET